MTPVEQATPTSRTFSAPPRPTPGPAELAAAAARRYPPARPGSRDQAPSDYSVTSKIERLPDELTPAPLPPSPAAEAADVWFEQVPTNPAAVPDLSALTGGTGADVPPYAAGNSKIRRQPTGDDPWRTEASRPAPARVAHRPPWLLPVLIAATCLAVGMVFGALIFGGGKSAAAPQVDDAGVCRCVER